MRCPCSWLFGKSIMTHFRLGFWAQDDDAECQNCDGAMENPSAINQNLPCQRLGFVRTAYRLKNLHWQRSKLFCKNKIVNTLARNSFICDAALRIATCIMISILQKSRLQYDVNWWCFSREISYRAMRILLYLQQQFNLIFQPKNSNFSSLFQLKQRG